MKKVTYKFTFPFTGQVKTQLIISGKRLVKPKNVKNFENAVQSVLATIFPIEERPINGYLKFEMYNHTQYKRDKDGVIMPIKSIDLDNTMKNLADCFQPIYKKMTVIGPDGNAELTDKGNIKYTKQMVTPGVIKDDKYIVKAGLHWIPVETKEEERIEVYITPISEKDLFKPRKNDNNVIDLSL